MWHDMVNGWGWGMGFGMIGMALFWIVMLVAIVLLVRRVWDPSGSSKAAASRTALDIVRERYARGEIDKQEFEEKKRDLSS